MPMPRAYMVYNPAAGRYPSRILSERAAEVLRSNGWQIRIEQTRHSEHIGQLARQAVAQEMDAFLIVGGDGSLNQAVASLMDTNTAMGVLPGGTANVWAQELGLPGLTWTRWMALEESARRLLNSQVQNVDIGLCNGHPFLLWAGVGLDAFIVHRLEPRRRWEKHLAVVSYTASAVWSATAWRGMDLRIELDDQIIRDHYLLAAISNIQLYAGGYARLSPKALLDDNTMELWLFKGKTLGDIVQLAWNLLSGAHLHSDQVTQIPFQSLRLESDTPIYVQIDGEPLDIQGSTSVNIQVKPRALRVLVPETTPHPLFGHPTHRTQKQGINNLQT